MGRQLGLTQAQAQFFFPEAPAWAVQPPWGRQGGPWRFPGPAPELGRGGPCYSFLHVANPD